MPSATACVVTLIRDELRRLRTGLGRCPHPVTLIVDLQSVKGASTVSRATRGFDPAKLINGRKIHVAVDTKGFPVMITVAPADMQDRDAARELLQHLLRERPQADVGVEFGAGPGTSVGVLTRRRLLRSDLGDRAELELWLGTTIQRLADG